MAQHSPRHKKTWARWLASNKKNPSLPSRQLELEALEARTLLSATVLDLTTPGSSGVIAGALFSQVDPQPTGTGVIHSFVRIQTNKTVEQGYNTDARKLQFDENSSPQFTRSLKLGDVPVVVVNGVSYREFLLDINQQGSAPLLSLDELRLFIGNAPNLKGYNSTTKQLVGLNAIYDLDGTGDAWIKLDYNLNSGSGSGDMTALIPDQLFVGATINSYIYLFSRFGDNHANNSGFEEWAARAPTTPVPPAAPASLAGNVYADENNDGQFTTGELGIAGVAVTLTGMSDLGPVIQSTTTNATGAYSFPGLRPGTYTLTENQPNGFLDGKDTLGSLGGTLGNDVFSNVVLTTGASGINYNFGELSPSRLTGYVYSDINNDGLFTDLELGIPSATVTLTGVNDLGEAISASYTTATGGNIGYYEFTNLRPGTYTLAETQPAGYLDGKDTIGTPGGTAGNDVFSSIMLEGGVDGASNNFGELLPSSLAGFVYVDLDNDGIKDAGEADLSAVTLSLTGTDDLNIAVSASATTDANGVYLFEGLRPGLYEIMELQPASYLDGKDTIGSPGGDTANDRFFNIPIQIAGTKGVNNNFGELLPGSLAGFVYLDANDDGVKQAGETGISNVTVTLTGTDDLGAVNRSAATDSSGAYVFADLRPGTYTLTESQPFGFVDGKDTIGTPGGTAGNDVFSAIVLNAGVNGTDNNFGERLDSGGGNQTASASLTGHVFEDFTDDGVFDEAFEYGIGDAMLTLSGTDNQGQPVNRTTMTDYNGAFAFADVPAGTYTLTEDQPDGYVDGQDSVGTQGGTASHNDATNQDVFTFTFDASADGVNNDFGELPPSILSGHVYLDANHDASFDQVDETGINGVLVTLTGNDNLGNPVHLTTTTADFVDEFGNVTHGYYAFPNLRPSAATGYTLTETQPADYQQGQHTAGSLGGDASVQDVISHIVLPLGMEGTDYDFGELLPPGEASVAGFVYADTNNNGLFEPGLGETGIAGATVALTGVDDNDNPIKITLSSADGAYLFANLPAGTYTLTEAQPAGYLDGLDARAGVVIPGSAGGPDSIGGIVLQNAEQSANNNFGELLPGSLAGFVFLDTSADGYNDGIFQGNEGGIFGAIVTLTGTDDLGNDVFLETSTDIDGSYRFQGLRPGTYQIQESQPPNTNDGKDTAGTLGGVVDGTPGDTSADRIYGIVLNAADVHGLDYNFGELLASS